MSNGDMFNVTITDHSRESLLLSGYSLSEDDSTFEVEAHGLEDLTEITEAELSENVDIVYMGVDKSGSILSAFTNEYLPNVRIRWEENGSLSNGDMVTFTIAENAREIIGNRGYFISEDLESFEVEVEGLTELIELTDEYFRENAEAVFTGYDTLGKLTQVNFEEAPYLRYIPDVAENLSNGDIITLTVADGWEDVLRHTNYTLAEETTSFEVEVSGLDPRIELTAEDLMNNLDITFRGYDTIGTMNNISQKSYDLPSFEYEYASSENLSNGDIITFTVTEESRSGLEGTASTLSEENSSFDIEVTGLDDVDLIDIDDMEKNIIITFKGVDGRGQVDTVTSTFTSDYSNISFEFPEDQKFTNGDEAEIVIEDRTIQNFGNRGIAFTDEAKAFSVPVVGLSETVDDIESFNNLDDIYGMIDELIDEETEDVNPDREYGRTYEVNEIGTFFRQYDKEFFEHDANNRGPLRGDSMLIEIFEVIESAGAGGDVNSEEFRVIGYANMFPNEDGDVIISDLITINEEFDTYNLDMMNQVLDGMDFVEVE